MPDFFRIVFLVFRERNQACQRGNQRAESADVDGRKQARIVCGKVGEQYGARYIADQLAGKNAEQQCIDRQKLRKEAAYGRDSCKVAAEYEKGAERAKKRIVYFAECLFIKKEKRQRDGKSA